MISLLSWVEIIAAVLKFPTEILRLVQLFQATPQEKHEDLLKSMEAEAEKMAKDGRPVWD